VNEGNVFVSRRGAAVAAYLHGDSVEKFREAIEGRENADQIDEPYRGWFLDVRSIPEDARARYIDTNTGDLVIRQIISNI
jgi:hypothetical protein